MENIDTEEQVWRRGKVSREVLVGVMVFLISFAGLAWIQFASEDLVGVDGYYHIRFAALMREEGIKPEFRWLPLTILNQREFYDHHFLYHIALIPFTLGDVRLGGKWAAVTFTALAFVLAWVLLRQGRVPYASLWTLGLFGVSEAFLYRMSMVRVQSLSLAWLFLGCICLMRRKWFWLAIVSFLYVWMYDAFPLILGLAGCYFLAVWIVERRLELKPLFFSLGGVILGLLINIYFPYDVIFVVRHLAPKLSATTVIPVGSEWYPYKTSQLLENSLLSLAAIASGYVATALEGKRVQTPVIFAFLVMLVFGLMLFQARRFIEYFPPFAWVFTAFAWKSNLEEWENKQRMKGMREEIKRRLPALILGMIVLGGGIWMIIKARESVRASKPYTLYERSATWLLENTPAGGRVFQTDWDDFPRLFYYNTHNTYLVGLDATYLQLYNEELYQTWVRISQGKVENPSKWIGEQFGCQYVFTDIAHTAFLEQARRDAGLIEVYGDDEAVIFQLKSGFP
jgi:hypothetical protein